MKFPALSVWLLSGIWAIGSPTVLANQSNQPEVEVENKDVPVIVVHSDWRGQSVNALPSSLVVLLDEQIKQRSAQHLDELLRSIGNVNFNSGASRGRFVQIRGIGERSQFQDPINPSVGFYVDGIDFSGVMGGATLYDVSQVEVLRGPQGTRFGANALAGAIFIETESARSEKDKLDLMVAEQNSLAAGLAIGHQFSEAAAMRFSLQQNVSDGFIKNTFKVRDDTNNIDELSARWKFDWDPSADVNLKFALHHWDIDNGYDAFSLDNNRLTRSDEPGFDRQQTDAVSLQGALTQFETGQIEFSLAVSDSQLDYGYDEDWTFDGFHPFGYSSFDRYTRDKDTINSDIRWVSSESFDVLGLPTAWLVGLYAKKDEETLTRQYTFFSDDFNSVFETDTTAVYAETQSALSAATQLTLGLRVESRQADYRDAGFNESTDETMFGGRIALEHALSSRSMIYGLLARGFKAGGVNPQSNLAINNRSFDSESNWNVELGYKATVLQGEGSLRFALFHMTRRDQQTKNWQVITRDDNTQAFIGYVANVDNGTNQGAELEFNWRVNDWYETNASLGFLDTNLDEIRRLEDDAVIVLTDREQAQAPNYSYHWSNKFMPDEHWFSIVTFEGKDEEFFSDNHELKNPKTDLIHLQIGYQTELWRVALWSKNITNETIFVRGFGSFGNDPRNNYATEPYFQLGDPRQTGLSFNYQF